MGGSKVTWLSAPKEKSRLPSFLLKISPGTAEGWRWRCPRCPDTRVPQGGQGVCAPAEAEPSHGQGGRCLLRVPGAGGAAGPGLLQPHVVVGCLWVWGKKTGVRGSQSPLVHSAHFFHGRCDLLSRSNAHLPSPPMGFWLQRGLRDACTYLSRLGEPLKPPIP